LLWAETFLAVLLDAGFSDEDAGQAFGRITMLINPLFLLDELPDRESSGDLVMLPGLPSMDEQLRAFPSLARAGRHMNQVSFDAMFEQNADALVATFEAELAADLGARRTGRTDRTQLA
jgi:hypothetical protein